MTPRALHLAILAALLWAGASFGGPSVVFAQDEEDGPAQEDPEPEVSSEPPSNYDRLLAIQVTGGLDTPLGVAGAAIEFAPVRYLAIYAGGGVSRSGARAGLRV